MYYMIVQAGGRDVIIITVNINNMNNMNNIINIKEWGIIIRGKGRKGSSDGA